MSSRELVVITPELQPGSGGLADYTWRVVEQWPRALEVRFIVPAPADATLTTTNQVDQVARKADALRERLPAGGGKVLLQYSGYGFDRWGYPRWLLHALLDWKQRSGGVLVVMLHEIWTFWPRLNKNYFVQQLHRRDLAKLCAVADAIFTSTASQAEHLRALTPSAAAEVLPVGSNVSAVADETTREPGVAVLFGLETNRLRGLREMHVELKALGAAGKIERVVTFGAARTEAGHADEQRLLAELNLPRGFEQRAQLPEAEASRALRSATFALSAQDKRSLTKSGTFMAYAAHGLNVVSLAADPRGPEPLPWLTSPAELLSGISAEELRSRSERLCGWQERTASWPQIAARFARALQLGTPSS